VAKPGDKAVAAPHFNVAAIDQVPGQFDRLGVVGAHQRLERDETPVKPDGIRPIFDQLQSPLPNVLTRAIAITDLSRCLSGTELKMPKVVLNSGSIAVRLRRVCRSQQRPRLGLWSAGLFRVDANDIDHVSKFVGDFQPPVLSWRKCRVEIAKYLTCRSRRFAKSSAQVGKFLAFGIEV
jgi:hypothetical protein